MVMRYRVLSGLLKRLSGNDTLANGTHQAGPYIPKDFLFHVFPAMDRPEEENPEVWFFLHIDSHQDSRKVRAVWYNNKLRDGTRDEARMTNLGGANSALLDPQNTGALCVFSPSLSTTMSVRWSVVCGFAEMLLRKACSSIASARSTQGNGGFGRHVEMRFRRRLEEKQKTAADCSSQTA